MKELTELSHNGQQVLAHIGTEPLCTMS
jgi:hypothetical protein